MLHRVRTGLAAAALLAAGAASAEPVTVVIGLNLPPYVIEEDNSGFEYEIVERALALAGYEMQPVYVPYVRVPTEIERGGADAAMTINAGSGLDLCYSDSHVAYIDYAISLAERDIRIEEVSDLGAYSVRAFHNAKMYLGEDFAAAVADNPNYVETGNQLTQNAMLFTGRIDVVVSDINIFNWLNRELDTSIDRDKPVTLHDVFEPVVYSVGFRDAALCARFNEGLAELRSSGEYDAIVQRYRAVLPSAAQE